MQKIQLAWNQKQKQQKEANKELNIHVLNQIYLI